MNNNKYWRKSATSHFHWGDVLQIKAERGINVNAMELKNTINVIRFSQDASWPGMVVFGPKLSCE